MGRTYEGIQFHKRKIILTARLKFDRRHLTVIGTYAPEEGTEEESEQYYKELQRILSKTNNNDDLILPGDLIARIGKNPRTKGEDHISYMTMAEVFV